MDFDYFYKDQADSYTFYKIPKMFFTEEMFSNLSMEAKVVYGLLLDRMSLSRENEWIDGAGHVYIYFTIKEVRRSLRCGNTKACRLFKELDSFGLIERKNQGLCKPSIIYLKDFTRFPKWESRSIAGGNPGDTLSGSPDIRKREGNKTDDNNTDINKTDPILSEGPVDNSRSVKLDEDKDEEERREYLELLHDQLALEYLYDKYPYDRETIAAIVDLIIDIFFSKRKTIRIAGDDKPVKVVKSQLLKLNASHIEYVLTCLKGNGAKVRNIKQYLLAAIYNAPFTMKSYYQAWVNNDMAEGRL